MVFAHFGIVVSEDELAKEVESDADIGTEHHAMIEAVKQRGLHAYVNDNASLEELRYFMDTFEVPIIIRYLEPDKDEDHYAVVIGVSDEEVVLNDPWHGARVHFRHDAFTKRWTCDVLGTCNQWLMAVSTEPFPLGHQYHPNATT